jgi:hypothetical protein
MRQIDISLLSVLLWSTSLALKSLIVRSATANDDLGDFDGHGFPFRWKDHAQLTPRDD